MGKYLADSYDAALRENDDLKARLARELDGIKALEAVIVSRGERLAEAEALLRDVGGPVAGIGWVVPNSWRTKRDAFLAPDSASHRENGSHG